MIVITINVSFVHMRACVRRSLHLRAWASLDVTSRCCDGAISSEEATALVCRLCRGEIEAVQSWMPTCLDSFGCLTFSPSLVWVSSDSPECNLDLRSSLILAAQGWSVLFLHWFAIKYFNSQMTRDCCRGNVMYWPPLWFCGNFQFLLIFYLLSFNAVLNLELMLILIYWFWDLRHDCKYGWAFLRVFMCPGWFLKRTGCNITYWT